jgi:hypothetical protein
MHTQTIEAAAIATRGRVGTASWQRDAVEKHERFLPDTRSRPRTDLAAQLLGLTATPVALEKVHDLDVDGRFASARVDGEAFRLYRGGDLVLARPCSYCETGRFQSPRIIDDVELGYALAAWHPLHEGCECYDVSEILAAW